MMGYQPCVEAGMARGKRQSVALSDVVGGRGPPYATEKCQGHTTQKAKQRELQGCKVMEADLATLYTWKDAGVCGC
jgi:hypothetical protein